MFRPVHEVTVGDLLARLSRDFGSAEAMAFPELGVRRSFRDLESEARILGRALLDLGVRKGDRVAIWAPNLPEWIAFEFAIAKVGAILVTINTACGQRELEHFLSHCDARVLVMGDHARGADFHALARDVIPELQSSRPGQLHSARFPSLEAVVTLGDRSLPGGVSYADLITRAASVPDDRLRRAEQSQDPTEVINMQYTSGTTGRGKAVMLTHRNIIENGFTVAKSFELTPNDRLCCPVPLFHCFGCVLGVLAPFTHGATTVPCVQFRADVALSLVASERCTIIYGVPTMFVAELESPNFGRFDLRSLRAGVMGGAPCPPDLVTRVIRDMPCAGLCIGYGLTETSPAVTFSDPGEPPEVRSQTVGRPIDHVELSIQDLATRRPLGVEEPGEICVRGPFVMKGYFRDGEATREAIDGDGWFHTGDLGVLDSSGRLRVTGRANEMIIRGGENIYPREIEEFLRLHPSIADVAVFGVSCKHHGEDVGAALRMEADGPRKLSARDLRAYCLGVLAEHKIPTVVMVIDEFPMTGSGKVQKFRLGERAAAHTKGDCATLRDEASLSEKF
ncbi:MAG: AMP-binding protein [Planctomycetes bacterium]|nr:AMP-binding protein [Planctomycetota bacterium]